MSSDNNEQWIDYEQAYIAYFDVLGFKKLVENNDHENLKTIYDKVFTQMAIRGSTLDGISSIPLIFSLIISDTIIFWTDASHSQNIWLIMTCAKQLLACSLEDGLPLRGCVIRGPLSIKQFASESSDLTEPLSTITALVGKSIADAHKIAEEQNWSGCIIDESVMKKNYDEDERIINEESSLIQQLIKTRTCVKYDVPLKCGHTESKYVIDWTDNPLLKTHQFLTKDLIRDSFYKHNKLDGQKPLPEDVKKKLSNTLKFFDEIKHLEFQY